MLNLIKWIFILMIMVGGTIQALPLGKRENIEVPTSEMFNFMRRFGYLDKNPSDSEALYHETAIIEAIKNVQKYGALNQTGMLDSMTVVLFTKARCGVPDVEGKPYYISRVKETTHIIARSVLYSEQRHGTRDISNICKEICRNNNKN